VEFEELNQGEPEQEPAGLGPLTWVAVAVGAVLAGVLILVFTGGDEPLDEPVPTAAALPGPSVRSDLALAFGPGQNLALGRICPAVTDGRKTLTVSFTLVNVGDLNVTLVDVKPVLPMAGLRPRGPNVAGGTCEEPGTDPPGGLLTPGDTQLITMRFRLPAECPQPYPVQARVRLRVNQMVGMTTVSVYDDLGTVDFNSCPVPG